MGVTGVAVTEDFAVDALSACLGHIAAFQHHEGGRFTEVEPGPIPVEGGAGGRIIDHEAGKAGMGHEAEGVKTAAEDTFALAGYDHGQSESYGIGTGNTGVGDGERDAPEAEVGADGQGRIGGEIFVAVRAAVAVLPEVPVTGQEMQGRAGGGARNDGRSVPVGDTRLRERLFGGQKAQLQGITRGKGAGPAPDTVRDREVGEIQRVRGQHPGGSEPALCGMEVPADFRSMAAQGTDAAYAGDGGEHVRLHVISQGDVRGCSPQGRRDS